MLFAVLPELTAEQTLEMQVGLEGTRYRTLQPEFMVRAGQKSEHAEAHKAITQDGSGIEAIEEMIINCGREARHMGRIIHEFWGADLTDNTTYYTRSTYRDRLL